MRQLLRITATFALALVFSAGMAFGQENNEATVNQTGDDNEAEVIQFGVPAQNTPGPSKAFLDQENGSEASIIQQGGNTFEGPNIFTGFNGNNAFQKNGELELFQGGQDNIVRLDQVGGEADLFQFGSFHRMELTQGPGSEAMINQPANESESSVNHTALVDQNANDFADVDQGTGFGDDNAFLDLDQTSGNNSAIIEQFGDFTDPNGEKGPNNVARLEQSGGSDAEVYQDGRNHRLSGTTGKGSFATQQNGSFLRLNQTDGDNNWTALDQQNGKQIARLDQNDGSTAEVLQKNGQGTVANRLSGTTGKGSFVTQNSSTLDLLQNGNNNWTAVDQFSEGNTANITQKGDGNTVTMQQGLTP